MKDNKLILKDVKLLFVELNDKDFGSSITLDVNDEAVRSEIEKFYASENIKPKFKDYTNKKTGEITKQYNIKLASFASIRDEENNEWSIDEIEKTTRQVKLGFGATVSVVIRAYDYDNKFGKGRSASVSALRIVKGAELKDDMEDLL